MLLLVFDTLEETNKFLKLYNAYGKDVYYMIKNYIHDEYLIEDISQDVFIVLAKHLSKIDPDQPAQAKSYIISIARSRSINYLRDHNKIAEAPLDADLSLHPESDEVLNEIIRNEDISSIAQAVSELNDIYKSVLELKYINEFSNDEIAEFLNIKKKTVVERLYRANIMLRNKLRERFDDK